MHRAQTAHPGSALSLGRHHPRLCLAPCVKHGRSSPAPGPAAAPRAPGPVKVASAWPACPSDSPPSTDPRGQRSGLPAAWVDGRRHHVQHGPSTWPPSASTGAPASPPPRAPDGASPRGPSTRGSRGASPTPGCRPLPESSALWSVGRRGDIRSSSARHRAPGQRRARGPGPAARAATGPRHPRRVAGPGPAPRPPRRGPGAGRRRS
mmetsp:Transcript_76934/g.217684  ORF Transcript_76934/g.217684 Transcript_76934/m.217684 type:complete len:207 (-) Transcript_76934:3-623(-)